MLELKFYAKNLRYKFKGLSFFGIIITTKNQLKNAETSIDLEIIKQNNCKQDV